MALAALSGDEQCIIFGQLCNVLDPGVAVTFSSASSELWTLTQAPRQPARCRRLTTCVVQTYKINTLYCL